MEDFTDETVLWFGVHNGKKLANIPPQWFLWYEEQSWTKDERLMAYIADNKMVLLQEVDLKNVKNGRHN